MLKKIMWGVKNNVTQKKLKAVASTPKLLGTKQKIFLHEKQLLALPSSQVQNRKYSYIKTKNF